MWLSKAAQLLNRTLYPAIRIINSVGIGILAVMMFLTAVDVSLRYVFNRPIPGSMELTELMMAVLVAFGLGYTQIHKGHVAVDLVISRFRPRVQAVINTITCLFGLGIFSLITWRTILYAGNQRLDELTSSVLLIPLHPFIYVVAFGSAILCLVFIYNLFEHLAQVVEKTRWWASFGLLLIIALVMVLFAIPVWGQELILKVEPLTAGLFGICLLIVLLFSGMPIGIVMALVGFLGMAYIVGTGAVFTSIGATPYSTSASYGLSVIPLFVLMGAFCFYSGLSRDLYYTVYRWLGHLPGGLAMATVGACAGFAAVSGSSVATVATMGTVALPEMRKYKYDSRLATGCIAAGGSIGILIPPSVILVIYGILTEQSIGKLFLAGFIPGVLEAAFYMITIYILCRRNPLMGPRGERASIIERFVSLKGTWAVIALFVLVIGGIYMGVFTPTEAAGVGAFGALLFALGKRQLTWKRFTDSLIETGKTTAMCFLILIGAVIFGYFLAVTRLPFELADIVAGMEVNRYIVLVIIIILYLFLGAIMSAMAMIILTVPIFFPVIVALGFDPIWFGIIIVRVVEMGQITPPVGINVFIIKGVAKDVPLYTIFRGIVPFLIADLLHVILLVAVPQIALFLPNLMK
ncbi:TRAP transporter large permease subunit [Chloroflexota bacterium]